MAPACAYVHARHLGDSQKRRYCQLLYRFSVIIINNIYLQIIKIDLVFWASNRFAGPVSVRRSVCGTC